MELSKLKNPIPYKWRVQSKSKDKKTAFCVAYIDARQLEDSLDSICGPENWKNEFRRDSSGVLSCLLSIRINNEWVTKWGTGTESNIEAQKGEASDAFKRAGVKWGVGRFLYDLPIFKLPCNGYQPTTREGQTLWDGSALTKYINSLVRSPEPPALKLSDLIKDLKSIHTTEGVKAFYLSHGNKDYPAGLRAAVIARNEEIVKELESEKAAEKKTVGGVLSWTITSKTNPGQKYKITQGKKTGWGCTCKAFQTRKKGEFCKHVEEIIETIASNGKGQ